MDVENALNSFNGTSEKNSRTEEQRALDGEVRYSFLTGIPEADLQSLAKLLVDETAEDTGDLVSQADIIKASGLSPSTAHGVLQKYDEYLLKNKMAVKRRGTDVRQYKKRTANFLRYQAAYRKEYGLSITAMIELLESAEMKDFVFVSDEERVMLKLLKRIDQNNRAQIDAIVERVVQSVAASDNIDIILENIRKLSDQNAEQSNRIAEQGNRIAEQVIASVNSSTGTSDILAQIKILSDQNEALRKLIENPDGSQSDRADLIKQVTILKDQYKDLDYKYRSLINDLTDSLDRIGSEAARMAADTENIGFMGLNKLKSANKDHLDRINEYIGDAKRKIGEK